MKTPDVQGTQRNTTTHPLQVSEKPSRTNLLVWGESWVRHVQRLLYLVPLPFSGTQPNVNINMQHLVL